MMSMANQILLRFPSGLREDDASNRISVVKGSFVSDVGHLDSMKTVYFAKVNKVVYPN
jgi:hypothetical protein